MEARVSPPFPILFLSSNGGYYPKNRLQEYKRLTIPNTLHIERIIAGDQAEVRKLARLVTEWVYNVVMSYVRSKEDTEEIVQDTILKALQQIDTFKQESTLKTWIYTIAINKSKDVQKYKSRQKRAGVVFNIDEEEVNGLILKIGNYDHPGKSMESKEQVDILFAGINQLPPLQKQALTITKLEQLSMKEAAVVMETTPKAIEGLVGRAKSNLKAYLETEGIKIYKKRKHGR